MGIRSDDCERFRSARPLGDFDKSVNDLDKGLRDITLAPGQQDVLFALEALVANSLCGSCAFLSVVCFDWNDDFAEKEFFLMSTLAVEFSRVFSMGDRNKLLS